MSVTWTNRPPRDEWNKNYRLARVGPKGSVRGIILNRTLSGTGLHYWKGKSVPCNGSKCEACRDGMKPRWYGYVALWNPKTDAVQIAEITDGAADELDRYFARHNSLRGAVLTLSRQGARPNGRIISQVDPPQLSEERLPAEPDVMRCLEKIWGVNENHESVARRSAKTRSENTNGHAEKPAHESQR